jgi:hypothetical protein
VDGNYSHVRLREPRNCMLKTWTYKRPISAIRSQVSGFPRPVFRLCYVPADIRVDSRLCLGEGLQGRFFQARSFSAVSEAPLPITSIPLSVVKWALQIQPDTALRLVVTNPFDIRSGNHLPLDGSASFQCPMNDVA